MRRKAPTALRATHPPRPLMSMTTSPGAVRAASSAATTFSAGGGAKRSKAGSWGPWFGRISEERGSAIRVRVYPRLATLGPGQRWAERRRPASDRRPGLLLVVGVVLDRLFLDERLILGDVGRQDAADVLDFVVLVVELELVLEVHLLTHERAFGVRAQVADLGRRGERHLAVVGRILVRLADDDAHVALADRRHAGGVLVPVGDELPQPRGHARPDGADVAPFWLCRQPWTVRRKLHGIARIDLCELLR